MEIVYTILGLIMIYSWVHSAIIVYKKIKGTTGYEQAVLIVGLVGFALYLFGTLSD